MKNTKAAALVFTVLAGAAILVASPLSVVNAQSPQQKAQEGVNAIGGSDNTLTVENSLQQGINVFLFFVGAIAVIMLIYGGFRYITSGGEASALSAAKNTIMYAVIGLVVVILAGAIANFAINIFNEGGNVPSDCTEAQRTGDPC